MQYAAAVDSEQNNDNSEFSLYSRNLDKHERQSEWYSNSSLI